jgi:hypothetical protein
MSAWVMSGHGALDSQASDESRHSQAQSKCSL